VISPLLANLYLHLLDRIWERHELAGTYGARLVRYADDLVILCAGKVEEPMRVSRQVLERLGLRLNETKTRVVDARKEPYDFLGFSFHLRREWQQRQTLPACGAVEAFGAAHQRPLPRN
jgi:RNA-directed DNA polymerase